MDEKIIFKIFTSGVSVGIGVLFLIGFVRGIYKYIKIKFVNKNLTFTYLGEEELK